MIYRIDMWLIDANNRRSQAAVCEIKCEDYKVILKISTNL